ncbi:MAG: YfbM family protein [Methanomassiliicoccaceae archaeon]|nr:YfbM family protein [Methanomassiliicoccaceae archaeon]
MDEAAVGALADFTDGLRKKLDGVNAAKGKEAEALAADLSSFIERNMRELMQQGISVAEIQKAVQAATERVPQTHASDAEGGDEEYEDPELLVSSSICFLPAEDAVIAAFAAGEFGGEEMMNRLTSSEDEISVEMSEGLDLVLTDYGKDPSMDDVTGGGEIVTGPDGEAFAPGTLDLGRSVVAEPMVFKTSEEVRDICKRLEPFTEKAFLKRADIRKLIKHGWLEGYDPKSVMKEADYIISAVRDEFTELREIYRRAAEQNKGMAIFVRYEEIDDEG